MIILSLMSGIIRSQNLEICLFQNHDLMLERNLV